MKKIILRLLFLLLFIGGAYYIAKIETEKYQSDSIVLLKDLDNRQKINLSQLISGGSSNNFQDSKILELYIRSYDMFNYLNKEENLTKYYLSPKLDFLQRLYKDTKIPYFKLNKENLLRKYNEDLIVTYDDPSGTLKISFIHISPKKAQELLKKIIKKSENIVNSFARENAEIALKAIEKQRKEKKKIFINSIKKLIKYQNKHQTIDPTIDVTRKTTLLSELEAQLIKLEVEYNTKAKIYNPNSTAIKAIKDNIINLKRQIRKIKKALAGKSKKSKLNKNVFEYELLKNEMEFAKEVYRQTLINQEELKVELAQKSKHLIIISKPTLPDFYTYPNKIWDIMVLFIVILLGYGIITSILIIIENHQD